jgi:thiazole synthase ThiGH ThiG subunit
MTMGPTRNAAPNQFAKSAEVPFIIDARIGSTSRWA